MTVTALHPVPAAEAPADPAPGEPGPAGRPVRRWPLFLIASPAAVAVWSGWVGLGGMCGFGIVHPLPGIADGFQLNTAITLPVGVEAYGAYALGAWLTPHTPAAGRRFARRSALGALALGMAGQVIYHLLAAAHAIRAPWPVVVLVACLPVITLGFGAALTHLLRADPAADPGPGPHPADAPGTQPRVHPVPAPAAAPETAPRVRPAPRTRKRTRKPVTEAAAETHFAADLSAGRVPSGRRIRAELHVGQDRARQLRDHLATLARTAGSDPS
jgi:hypothetical protein